MASSRSPSDVDSNAELSERLARVEEQIDHQSEVLDRIEQNITESHNDVDTRLETIEPRHQRLWHAYQSAKWLLAIGSGGGVLALLVGLALPSV